MTNSVDIRPDHLRIVQGVLQDHLPADVKAWVFGSRAQWSAREGSDLDLALRGETEIDRTVMDALVDAFEDSDLPYTVDVVDINRVSKQFRQIVDAQKVRLTGYIQSNLKERGQDLATENGSLYHPHLPEHWERRPLYSLAQWVNGLAFRNIQFSPSGKPIIKIAEIKGGISGQTKFTQQVFDESVRVRTGDLLFAWSGQPETSIDAYHWSGPEGWLNQHIFRVTPGSDVDPSFFYYLLKYLKRNFVDIARNKQTTGLGHVTKRDLENIEAAIPAIEEQRAIASALGALDANIELDRQMNETLEEVARALFKSWFVDFDPVRAKMDGRWRRSESLPGLPTELYDLFPARLVQTSMGDVPQGWKLGALTDMVVLLSGGTPKTSITEYWNGNIPWYTAKDAPSLSDVFVVDAERRISQAGLDNSSTQILPAGTTVITARGTVGRLACLGVPMAMNQTCYGIRGMDDYPDFFTYWNVRMAITELQARTHGTIFDTITRQTFRLVNVVIPPLVLATAFETEVAAFMNQILANLQASRNLAALRDLLLPNLMSSGLRESDVPA